MPLRRSQRTDLRPQGYPTKTGDGCDFDEITDKLLGSSVP
jgi:hypothetical protein